VTAGWVGQRVSVGGMEFIADPGAWVAVGAAWLEVFAGELWGIPVVGRGMSREAAIADLSIIMASMPWFGGAEARARSGAWVRRASWSDPARAVRFEAGLGSTRAVAVTQAAAVVTPSDFTAAEFLAADWRTLDDTAAPVLVNLSSWNFTAEVGTAFAIVADPATVVPAPGGGTVVAPPTTGDGPLTPGSFPSGAGGFVYLQNGAFRLVPGKTVTGDPWTP
jgi:hypothetical protein